MQCLGEDTEKYITFSAPIQKENENRKTATYQIKFINRVMFMASSLSSLIDKLAEGLHKGKCRKSNFALEYA